MSAEKEPCSVDGCGLPQRSKGWCEAHYNRHRLHGDVQAHIPLRPRRRTGCKVDGCAGTHQAQGWCKNHYSRLRTKGDVAADIPVIPRPVGLRRYTDEEMAVIADFSITTRKAAELVGIHHVTIASIRRDIDAGNLRLSTWLDSEIDFVIENSGRMTTDKMAKFLRRTKQQVQSEVRRLQHAGVLDLRTSDQLKPWMVGGRTLVAKTCLGCGHLLAADWYGKVNNQSGEVYRPNCRKCNSEYGMERAKRTKDADHKAWYEKVQAYTLERAERRGQEWTGADIEVLADPSKSNLEKALELKRTYASIHGASSKHGFASKPERLGDPSSTAWRIFWEFEDQAVAS